MSYKDRIKREIFLSKEIKEAKERRALERSEKRSERLLKKKDRKDRAEANALHMTYESDLEPSSDGWMKQHIVNSILSMFGGR